MSYFTKRLLLAIVLPTLASFAFAENAPDIKSLQQRAEGGNPKAQYELACVYIGGEFAPEDLTLAEKWMRKSAEQEYADAECGLGSMYDQFLLGQPNYSESEKWFRKAAEQGNASAQFALGKYYGEGRSSVSAPIPHMRTNAEGLKWMLKAADQGNVLAWDALANWYTDGMGVKKDYIEAYKWICVAFENGETREMNVKTTLERKLTREQIKEAQQRAKEWMEEYHKRNAAK